MTQELGYFDTASRGALSSRLSSDATKIADVVSFNLNILARQATHSVRWRAVWRATLTFARVRWNSLSLSSKSGLKRAAE